LNTSVFSLLLRPGNKVGAGFLILLAHILGNYWCIADFGLYEDDFSVITFNFTGDFLYIKNVIIDSIENTFVRGRPLQHIIPSILTYVGYNTAGLVGVHFFGALVNFINALLVFLLVRRSINHYAGLICAIIFVLYPVLTVKQYLTHALILQVSTTFCLLAMRLYLQNRKLTAYFLSTLCLFTYEHAYLPFLLTPLLESGKHLTIRNRVKRIAMHLAICGLVISSIAGLRFMSGDYRFTHSNYLGREAGGSVFETVKKLLSALYLGPLVCMEGFIKSVDKTYVWSYRNTSIFIWALAGALFGFIISFLGRREMVRFIARPDYASLKKKIPFRDGVLEVDYIFAKLVYMIIMGGLFSGVAYLFNLPKYPPNFLFTRNVSEHLASQFGMSLLLGTILTLVLYLSVLYKQTLVRRCTAVISSMIVAIIFSGLFGYGRFIQLDHVNVWKVQKSLWTRIIELAPEVKKGTRIFLINNKLSPFAINLQYQSWSMFYIYEQIFRMPIEWGSRGPLWIDKDYNFSSERNKIYDFPRLFLIRDDWIKYANMDENRVTVTYPNWIFMPQGRHFDVGNLIVFEFIKGKLIRKNGQVKINNGVLDLSMTGEPASFEKDVLYEILIDKRAANVRFKPIVLSYINDKFNVY
jgi:hypothetical protein